MVTRDNRSFFFKIFLLFAILVAIFLLFQPWEESYVVEQNNDYQDNANSLIGEERRDDIHSYLILINDKRDEFINEEKDFLEINLALRKVKLYQDGLAIKESPILALGDVRNWGGSATGIYCIKSKARSSYSTVSEVYMPYALHYYGKYYLHGEPYNFDGTKFSSDFSGGCIRLADDQAQYYYETINPGLPVIVVSQERKINNYNDAGLDFPVITATNYLVTDLESGLILAEKKSQEQKPIASITKMMTAVVVAENVNLERKIEVDSSMLNAYGSIQGLEEGKTFKAVELFYPLLIESSNNAAEILSHFLGRNRTINLMNQKAEAILMIGSEFVDPHGLSEGNIATARDIFQLTRYVYYIRPPLLEISRSKLVRNFGGLQFDVDSMWNKNIFSQDPNFIGGKTGFIKASRYTGTMIFRFLTEGKEMRDISIIYLGSESPKADVQRIYSWLMENFNLKPI